VVLWTSERAEMGLRILLLASAMGATMAAAREHRVEKRMVALEVGGSSSIRWGMCRRCNQAKRRRAIISERGRRREIQLARNWGCSECTKERHDMKDDEMGVLEAEAG
jgi:hypothetical protein